MDEHQESAKADTEKPAVGRPISMRSNWLCEPARVPSELNEAIRRELDREFPEPTEKEIQLTNLAEHYLRLCDQFDQRVSRSNHSLSPAHWRASQHHAQGVLSGIAATMPLLGYADTEAKCRCMLLNRVTELSKHRRERMCDLRGAFHTESLDDN